MTDLASSSTLIDLTPGRTSGCVWVQSDLQHASPERSREVLANAVDDMVALGEPIDAIWCLGDALSGSERDRLERVADVCIDLLEPLNVPICYMMGNHEMDLRESGEDRYPLYERVAERPGWHTMAGLDQPWFIRKCLGMYVAFFGDHADPDGQWWTQHHNIKPDDARYPHSPQDWQAIRDRLVNMGEPLVTVGHYAYPGGQRPSNLMAHLMPLPDTLRFHIHGHAHIGDTVYNPDRTWQRDNPITDHAQRQYNVSALEDFRSPGSHSAVLRVEAGQPRQLDIRCHAQRRWEDRFDLTASAISDSGETTGR